MAQRLIKVLMIAAIALAVLSGLARTVSQGDQPAVQDALTRGRPPIPEPYTYVGAGRFSGPEVPESPDPLVAYRWPNPKTSDGLEIFLLRPKAISATPAGSFENLPSLTGPKPDVTVRGHGRLR